MYSFKNDYSEGAHPRILSALMQSNLEQHDGYGDDRFSKEAIELIKRKVGRPDIDVHLLSGGTQTNLTAIAAFLRPHEAVIAAHTGHILVHETGAIEATGHKVVAIPTADGRLDSSQIQKVLEEHSDEHMVKPKLVYISNSTETGTIYQKKELEQLSRFCKDNNLILYMDGARLGSALTAEGNDLGLTDLGVLVDAFYIGGTKNGALIGEALVICRDELRADFRYQMKQRGAMLAKGRLLGIQFKELFQDDLYFTLASQANKMAALLREKISRAGFEFLTNSPTNQIFPILPNYLIHMLQEKYQFYVWQEVDTGHSAVRLVTSWATPQEAVGIFIQDMKNALGCLTP